MRFQNMLLVFKKLFYGDNIFTKSYKRQYRWVTLVSFMVQLHCTTKKGSYIMNSVKAIVTTI
jgi:hypothetical protein